MGIYITSKLAIVVPKTPKPHPQKSHTAHAMIRLWGFSQRLVPPFMEEFLIKTDNL